MPEGEVAPGRGDAEVDVVDQHLRAEDQEDADADEDDLGGEVGDGEDEVELGRLLRAADFEQRQATISDGAADVCWAYAQRLQNTAR